MSVGQAFALVAGFLALAAIGAAIGWTLTGNGGVTPLASPSNSPTVPTSSAPSASPTPTATKTQGLTVPDFNASGTSFMDARQQLASMKLGSFVVFNDGGDGDDTVVRTDPQAGQPVSKGQTVKVYVDESPPPLQLPDVRGQSCNSAGKSLASTGFTPEYPNGHSGKVVDQQPEGNSGNTVWEQKISLICGTVTPSPSAPPSTPSGPPGGTPSGPPS
jgi:hypothetical protein